MFEKYFHNFQENFSCKIILVNRHLRFPNYCTCHKPYAAQIMTDKKNVPASLKFVFGGLSGAGAVLCVQPIDLVKKRMQVCPIHFTLYMTS